MKLPLSRACYFLSLLVSFVLAACSSRWNAPTAITHVTVIDVNSGVARPDSTVLIAGTRISAVGPASSIAIPSHSTIIDATGNFLFPGLADMHVHLTGAGEPSGSREFFFPLLIANGITTVRDMGGTVENLKQLRSEVALNKRLGPQIFFTGPYLDGNPPYFQPSIVVENASEATVAVVRLKSEGVDFVKTQSRLSREAYFAAARECRVQNIRFVGHVPDNVSALEASKAGQASIEHLTGVLLATSSKEDELRRQQLAPGPTNESVSAAQERTRAWQRELLNSLSAQKTETLLRAFVANQTWQVPTFPVLAHTGFMTPQTDLRNDPRSKYLSSSLRNIWEQSRKASLENRTVDDFSLREQIVKGSLEIVGKMNGAGVPILAGTDAAAPNVFPGFSLHEDLVFLVRAGLTPLQALQAATLRPAQFLGRAQEQGSIAAGQRADLVLLAANPLDNIRNTQKIRAVVLNGKLLRPDDLDALLDKAARFAASH